MIYYFQGFWCECVCVCVKIFTSGLTKAWYISITGLEWWGYGLCQTAPLSSELPPLWVERPGSLPWTSEAITVKFPVTPLSKLSPTCQFGMFECHLKFVGEDETVYWPGKNEMLSITLIAVRYRDNSVLTSSVSVTKKYHTEPFSLHCCRRQQKHVDPQCNSAIKKNI